MGLTVTDYPAPDDRVAGGRRPNLVALLPGQRPEKVWVLSHLDVVPVGELNLWNTDPFILHVDGDLLYGRGVEDDHHGIVASFFAVRAFMEAGITPARTIGLALVVRRGNRQPERIGLSPGPPPGVVLAPGPDHRARRRQRRGHPHRDRRKKHAVAAPGNSGQAMPRQQTRV